MCALLAPGGGLEPPRLSKKTAVHPVPGLLPESRPTAHNRHCGQFAAPLASPAAPGLRFDGDALVEAETASRPCPLSSLSPGRLLSGRSPCGRRGSRTPCRACCPPLRIPRRPSDGLPGPRPSSRSRGSCDNQSSSGALQLSGLLAFLLQAPPQTPSRLWGGFRSLTKLESSIMIPQSTNINFMT